MRRLFLGSLMLLQCAAAEAGQLTMNDPAIRVVASVKQMRDYCGVDGTYDACTQFVSFKLEASCSAEGTSWRIRTAAALTPSIVLYNLGSLRHENAHIADMTGSVTHYMSAIEAQQFASPDLCRDHASAVMSGFGIAVRTFARESLDLRDPTTRPSRTDRARQR